MKLRTFNFIASFSAFILGALFVFSDGAGITANVIGASGDGAGLVSIIGVVMIIGAIGLFIVSQTSTDNHPLDLERLIRGTKNHTNLNGEQYPEEEKNMHTKKKD
jgi:hypothetical protein